MRLKMKHKAGILDCVKGASRLMDRSLCLELQMIVTALVLQQRPIWHGLFQGLLQGCISVRADAGGCSSTWQFVCFVALPEAGAFLFRSISTVDSSFVLRMGANRRETGIENV
jgi:hypothetical protein